MTTEKLFSRRELARKWGVSTRTIDRVRKSGRLSWINISAGSGLRQGVRFRLDDIQAYEQANRQG